MCLRAVIYGGGFRRSRGVKVDLIVRGLWKDGIERENKIGIEKKKKRFSFLSNFLKFLFKFICEKTRSRKKKKESVFDKKVFLLLFPIKFSSILELDFIHCE